MYCYVLVGYGMYMYCYVCARPPPPPRLTEPSWAPVLSGNDKLIACYLLRYHLLS